MLISFFLKCIINIIDLFIRADAPVMGALWEHVIASDFLETG